MNIINNEACCFLWNMQSKQRLQCTTKWRPDCIWHFKFDILWTWAGVVNPERKGLKYFKYIIFRPNAKNCWQAYTFKTAKTNIMFKLAQWRILLKIYNWERTNHKLKFAPASTCKTNIYNKNHCQLHLQSTCTLYVLNSFCWSKL